MAKKVDSTLQSLAEAENPENLGVPKKASLKGYFAYELGRSCRIIYRPVYNQNTIELLKVCSHREVYGP